LPSTASSILLLLVLLVLLPGSVVADNVDIKYDDDDDSDYDYDDDDDDDDDDNGRGSRRNGGGGNTILHCIMDMAHDVMDRRRGADGRQSKLISS
jgi:hypothetical protein